MIASKLRPIWFALSVAALTLSSAAGSTLQNVLVIPGETPDKTPLNGERGGAGVNRLGGFGSDLYYDRIANVFYGLTDRGPGGGTIEYSTRVQKFTLDIDPVTGKAGNFTLVATIPFTIPAGKTVNGIRGPAAFNGIDPIVGAGGPRSLGLSHDPEGFIVAPNGHFYVSDEYGPSIYEFLPDGAFVRALHPPENVAPADAMGTNYSASNTVALNRGRQRNRGFEGLAISPDGRRLFAILQDPLVHEGLAEPGCRTGCEPGRFSRNVRLTVFSTITGESEAQYVYQLEDLSSINARVIKNRFDSNGQGVNIGVSALTAINDHEFLVMERDNRGFGIDDTTESVPVSAKRVYRIDITPATDVSHMTFVGMNALPPGVLPVTKTLFIDLAQELKAAGGPVPEKIEGLTIGPRLKDGSYELLIATDNDFSVTQRNSSTQFDVCTNRIKFQEVPVDAGCPGGLGLLPTYLISFKTAPGEIELPSLVGELLTLLSDPAWNSTVTRNLTGRLRTTGNLISKGRNDQACKEIKGLSEELNRRSPGAANPLIDRLGNGLDYIRQTARCK